MYLVNSIFFTFEYVDILRIFYVLWFFSMQNVNMDFYVIEGQENLGLGNNADIFSGKR